MKLLALSTFPIARPRHGGQIRLSSIVGAYRDAGWEVTHLAVYEPESYGGADLGPHDLPLPASGGVRSYRGRTVPLINDLLAGHYAASDAGYAKILARLPESFDAVHVEQIWLWPFVRRLKADPRHGKVKVIYGSQNIEHRLKREILDSFGVAGAEDVVEEIAALEREAAREADLVAAVTRADLAELEGWGATATVLAANGIAAATPDPRLLERWRAKLPAAPWLLYVASAHPPNFTNLDRYLGGALGCFPPDSRLVVAGTVSEHVYRYLSATRWHNLNLSRLQLLFGLPDADLAAVRELAHGFVLPISVGGGSNLKTAEALYSGRYVVGSSTAFRGYEGFADLPEVFVADDADGFRAAIRKVLALPPSAAAPGEGPRRQLTWDACLHDLVRSAEGLVR